MKNVDLKDNRLQYCALFTNDLITASGILIQIPDCLNNR